MSFNIYPRSYEDQLEYKEWLSELIALTEQELPTPKPKNKSKKIGKKHITSHSSRPQKAASAEFSVLPKRCCILDSDHYTCYYTCYFRGG